MKCPSDGISVFTDAMWRELVVFFRLQVSLSHPNAKLKFKLAPNI